MSAAHCRKKHPCPNLSHHRSRHNLPTAETNVRYHPSRPASQHQLKAEVMPLLYTHDQPASMMNCFQCCSDICVHAWPRKLEVEQHKAVNVQGNHHLKSQFFTKQPALKDFRGKKQKSLISFYPEPVWVGPFASNSLVGIEVSNLCTCGMKSGWKLR